MFLYEGQTKPGTAVKPFVLNYDTGKSNVLRVTEQTAVP